MWNQSQMKYLDQKSLIDAPMQPYPCFLSFKLEEQWAGATFTICIEPFNCHCIVFRTNRLTHLENHLGVSWSRNCGYGTHVMHCFKNHVQRAKLTGLKVFQNDFSLFFCRFWLAIGTQITQYTLYCPVVVVNMFQTMSNGMLGTKIVDWCTNAIIFSFLGFQVGRTKGGEYVSYLYWNIQLLQRAKSPRFILHDGIRPIIKIDEY